MTRKDFELIAGAIRELPHTELVDTQTLVAVAHALADRLRSTNAHFDRVRFIEAATRGLKD